MTTPLSAEQLDELERLRAAATKGPWHYGGPDYPDGDMMFLCGPPGGPAVIAWYDASLGVEHDLKLAAAAVNALPSLLATARRERELREALERPEDVRWDPQEEHCQKCGRPVGVVWTAPEDLWAEVMGAPGGIRCIRCFDEEADAKGVPLLRWVPQPADVWPLPSFLQPDSGD